MIDGLTVEHRVAPARHVPGGGQGEEIGQCRMIDPVLGQIQQQLVDTAAEALETPRVIGE
ncbi:MAG: hypothetical protein U5L11_05095 [Arhodomonas sp.]|nr:hypothetical protein [Arhodomonas sp.]